jgi:hypothetical protein
MLTTNTAANAFSALSSSEVATVISSPLSLRSWTVGIVYYII